MEHRIGTREEWLAARKDLLEREKEVTHRNDELARERQELPWVPIEKEYTFDTDEGPRRCRSSSAGARSCSSTTSCSGPPTTRAALCARRAPTRSTVRSPIS